MWRAERHLDYDAEQTRDDFAHLDLWCAASPDVAGSYVRPSLISLLVHGRRGIRLLKPHKQCPLQERRQVASHGVGCTCSVANHRMDALRLTQRIGVPHQSNICSHATPINVMLLSPLNDLDSCPCTGTRCCTSTVRATRRSPTRRTCCPRPSWKRCTLMLPLWSCRCTTATPLAW